MPSDVLLDLIEARGLAAPLAARALSARDSRSLRPKLLALLASDDALLRSHVALGLGHSSESSALGVLSRAYRFETDAGVRLAIVRALAVRHEPARERTLRLARDLDGSRSVREAAALALAGGDPSGGPARTRERLARAQLGRKRSARSERGHRSRRAAGHGERPRVTGVCGSGRGFAAPGAAERAFRAEACSGGQNRQR